MNSWQARNTHRSAPLFIFLFYFFTRMIHVVATSTPGALFLSHSPRYGASRKMRGGKATLKWPMKKISPGVEVDVKSHLDARV